MPATPPPQLFGIYGGSFDPIHQGHMLPLQLLTHRVNFAKLTYIPAARSPNRNPAIATPTQRAQMVALALAQCGRGFATELEVDELELRRPPPSYTVDTLRELRARRPHGNHALILGLDAFLGLEKWHRWQELLELTHIIVMPRPGWEVPQELPHWWAQRRAQSAAELTQHSSGKILLAHYIPPVHVSSTQVREIIRRGQRIGALVPSQVVDYLRTHNLYRETPTPIPKP